MDLVGLTVVHLVGRHQADAGMVMILIVPIKEAAAEPLGILNTTETLRKLRLVFHGFEVAFRERIVIGGVRPAVGFGDAEIGEQQCRGLGPHRTTTIGVQSELALRRRNEIGQRGDAILGAERDECSRDKSRRPPCDNSWRNDRAPSDYMEAQC